MPQTTKKQQQQQFSVKEFDLSTDRNTRESYELFRLPQATYLATLEVPDECYIRFHTREAPALDLREMGDWRTKVPIGKAWISNPTGSTGTLKFLVGNSVRVTPNLTVDTIETITGEVDVDITSQTLSPLTVSDPELRHALSSAAAADQDSLLVDSNNALVTDLSSDITRSVGTVRGESADAYESGTALASGGSLTNSLSSDAAESVSGIVSRATTAYDLDIAWKNALGTVILTESIAAGVTGGTQTTFDVPARAPQCDVIVSDAGAGSGAVDLTAHLR